MVIIDKAKNRYKKLRDSDSWQNNNVLAFFHPAVINIDKFLIRCWMVARKVYRFSRHYLFLFFWHPLKRLWRVSMIIIANPSIILVRWAIYREKWALALEHHSKIVNKWSKRININIDQLNEARLDLSVLKRLNDIKAYKQDIEAHIVSETKRRIVVFTAITDNYDLVRLPEQLEPEIDYVLFSNTPINGSGVYDVRPMPYHSHDAFRQTRYVKTHAHQLLPDYDIAVWIDANIMISGRIMPLINRFIASEKLVAAIPHPLRNSLEEEAQACKERNKESILKIDEQIRHYQKLGYITDELIESGFMMFRLDHKIIPFLTDWWSEIDRYTRRDQLSLNYCLDKNMISWYKLTKKGLDVRNHPLLIYASHHVKLPMINVLLSKIAADTIDPYRGDPFYDIRDHIIADQQDRSIDIVYCVHNALKDVIKCLDSVVDHRKSTSTSMIIIDDGSDQSTADYLSGFADQNKSWVKLLRNDSAIGYTKAANQGLRQSRGELAILLNSDTIVTDGWVEKMADAVFNVPGAGIVGPLSSAASHQSIPEHIGSGGQTAINQLPSDLSAEDMNTYCEKWSVAGLVPRVPLVHGFCFGITRDAINEVGFFDEVNFPNGYGEENDYCFRATDAGFGLVLATNTYVFHAKSKSYDNAKRLSLMKQGSLKLNQLYGEDRVKRAIIDLQTNPILKEFRKKAKKVYSRYI